MKQRLLNLSGILILVFVLSSLSAKAEETPSIPPLDGKVLYAHGSFHSYSMMPAKGDKLNLNVAKLLSSGKNMISFTPSRKVSGPPPYIPILSPFKFQNDPKSKGIKYSYRLISQSNRAGASKVTIDIHKPRSGTNKWPIYIVYESRGIVEGIAILEGTTKASNKRTK